MPYNFDLYLRGLERDADRYFVVKQWRLCEDKVNYIGPPPQNLYMTSEEFDAAVDALYTI
jgi:hypothetical protein